LSKRLGDKGNSVYDALNTVVNVYKGGVFDEEHPYTKPED
jgi:hypothetical protein